MLVSHYKESFYIARCYAERARTALPVNYSEQRKRIAKLRTTRKRIVKGLIAKRLARKNVTEKEQFGGTNDSIVDKNTQIAANTPPTVDEHNVLFATITSPNVINEQRDDHNVEQHESSFYSLTDDDDNNNNNDMDIVTSDLNTEGLEASTSANVVVDENELDRIQNTFIEDIEIEFAECEIFPIPFIGLKTEGNSDSTTADSEKTVCPRSDVINSIETADTCRTLNQSSSLRHPLFGNLIFEMDEVRLFFFCSQCTKGSSYISFKI